MALINGDGGNNTLTGTSGNDTINGAGGDDILNAGLGVTDQIDGGTGTDILVVDYSSLTVNVGSYGNSYQTVNNTNRTYYSNIERFNLKSGSGNDTLVGGTLNDTLNGGAGNDSLIGGAGNDSIIGGSDNDIITKGTGNDTVDGGAGIDTLIDVDLSADTTGRVLNVNGSTIAAITSGGNSYQGFEFFVNISAGSGNDNISLTSPTPANNIINGAGGDDILNAGLGVTDQVDGGTGTDILVVDYSSLTVNVGSYGNSYQTVNNTNRTYYSNIERFNLKSGSGNDTLVGGTLNDTLNGGAGNDSLIGGAGNDSIIGGSDNDIITKGTGNDTVDGGAGIDTLIDVDLSADTTGRVLNVNGSTIAAITSGGNSYQGFEFFVNISAGSGNDNISLTSPTPANNIINGAGGDDILNAGLGVTDQVDGGTGTDILVVDYSSLTVNVGSYGNSYQTVNNTNRTYYSNIERFNLKSGSGNDTLVGGTLNDTINGGAGNDSLIGGAGDDIITQGAGSDTVDGGTGVDTLVDADLSADTTGRVLNINGSAIAAITSGGNTYQGFEFFLNITGGSGNDNFSFTSPTPANNSVNGGAGNDTINGGGGNDTINGGTGNDSLQGGTGNDTYIIDSISDVISETSTLATEIDTVQSSISYLLGANLENLTLTGTGAINGTGNSLNNIIIGNSGNNTLDGGTGNDTISGGSGNDTVTGGIGNDSLDGGTGDDSLIAGTGNDTYVVDSVGDVVIENLNEGTDTVQSSVSYTLGANVENLTLTGTGAINGIGNSLNNTITGNSGNNTLNGVGGNDILIGGAGNDTLLGGDGNDTLNGVGSENGTGFKDTLTGGNGNDLYIFGNSGAVFYNDGNNANAGLNDYALIVDFNTSQDKIQLQGLASSYLLGTSPISGISGTAIYLDTNTNSVLNSTDELIAIVEGVTGLNLTAGYFSYVA
uniref:Calcium-binding protein n=1 Tax=Desmonostoc muscorum LEGE 12446 TaxID=1828758 RepID=A0A8J7AES7_DESMC